MNNPFNRLKVKVFDNLYNAERSKNILVSNITSAFGVSKFDYIKTEDLIYGIQWVLHQYTRVPDWSVSDVNHITTKFELDEYPMEVTMEIRGDMAYIYADGGMDYGSNKKMIYYANVEYGLYVQDYAEALYRICKYAEYVGL